MAEHPNVTMIKEGIAAFNQGNPGALMAMIADDAVFHVPGTSPIAGEYRGKQAIGGCFRHMGQLSEGSQRIDLEHVLTSGDEYVVALWTATGARKGMQYEGLAGWIFRIQDGSIVAGRNLQEDQEAIDRFWSA